MVDSQIQDRLQANWLHVCDDVRRAAEASGREPGEIQIIGVSKYVDVPTTLALAQAGCLALGESRPQQLWQKAEAIHWQDPRRETPLRWHLIGHLQRNKIRRVLRHVPIIHSVDSRRVIEAIAEEAVAQGLQIDVLLEANISGEPAKTGLPPEELAELCADLPAAGIHVIGLMAMAGWKTDPNQARRQFARTRELRDNLVLQTGLALPELSMGMSGDFPQAIAEGATMVRIGSRLFEGIDRPTP
ncbi:MAG: YggS family pyridoxal phosphate-dependent enzyme [Pirellulales bacterium]|nr:YggS family pyridoxal phosphate-dependent enzyme [Pirellulales bacterium]